MTTTIQGLVDSQIQSFKDYADRSFSTALSTFQSISNEFNGVFTTSIAAEFGTHIETQTTDELPVYQNPTPIPVPTAVQFVAPDEPGDPPSQQTINEKLEDVNNQFSALSAPVYSITEPSVILPARPTTILPAAPDDPLPLTIPTYPDAPVYTDPSVPILRSVSLPVLNQPDLTTIEVLIAQLRANVPTAPVIPTVDFDSKVNTYYALTNQQLTTFLSQCPALAGINSLLLELLSGNSIGLPSRVAQSLRDRAFSAENQQAIQAEQTALSEWSSRGFTLPGGALEAKLAAIRQLNRDKLSQLNRDLWLEEAKIEIENLRFSIQQGIAYEGLLRDSWIKVYDLCRSLATSSNEIALRLFEAALSIYKAQLDAWQVEFSTLKDQLQIELAKLDIFKSELEGQKLIGQLNQQDVELYNAQWESISKKTAIYKTSVDAANSLLQAELAKLEYSTRQVSIYTAKINAYSTEWQAYSTAVQGEISKVDLYKSQVQAFSARVDAYSKEVDVVKTIGTFNLEGLKLIFSSWDSQLEKYKALLQTESSRIDSVVKEASVNADLFRTKSQVEDSRVDFEINKLGYILNVDKFNADIDIKKAELEQTKMLTTQKMTLEALDGIARTSSQLASAALSAMNVQASLQENSTDSLSHSYHYNYDMTG